MLTSSWFSLYMACILMRDREPDRFAMSSGLSPAT